MKILLTGGSGLLGTALLPLLKDHEVVAPRSSELNILNPIDKLDYDLIVHCAAYTNVNKAEAEDRKLCFDTNVYGTFNLLEKNKTIPFVYISSEFAAQPVNFYAKTKLLGEKLVAGVAENWIIIRTLFKPRPFTHDKAFTDQYTRGDYLDVIAPLIADYILKWDKDSRFHAHAGTERKTMFDLAKQTKPDVLPMSVLDIPVRRPTDYI